MILTVILYCNLKLITMLFGDIWQKDRAQETLVYMGHPYFGLK